MEAGDPGIDAACVSLEHRPLCRSRPGQHCACDATEAEQPRGAVLFDRHRAKELRELSCGETAREIHLEKAVLAVRKSGAVGQIGAPGSLDGRHPERIARDVHRRAEPRSTQLTVELRQRPV